jgi:hypothetical protein
MACFMQQITGVPQTREIDAQAFAFEQDMRQESLGLNRGAA